MASDTSGKRKPDYFLIKVSGSLLGALVLVLISLVAGKIMYQPQVLVEPAYRIAIPGGSEQLVDMAEVQKKWPDALRDPVQRDRLLLHMSEMRQKTDVSIPAPVPQHNDAPSVEPELNLQERLARADLDKGKRIAARCRSCHNFEKGGPNSVGPNLWNIVGSNKARQADFRYSDAMRSSGGAWDVESLFSFLEKPGAYIKGTKMLFAGIKKPQDRANLIAYLNTMSEHPLDFSIRDSKKNAGQQEEELDRSVTQYLPSDRRVSEPH